MTTTNRFEFRSTGNRWRGQLLDCTDPDNPVPVDLTGFDKVYVVFRKPNGIQIPTDDEMRDGFDQGAFLESPSTPEDSFIVFLNEDTPSFLDLKNQWQYTVAAKIGDTLVKSPLNTIFWVD